MNALNRRRFFALVGSATAVALLAGCQSDDEPTVSRSKRLISTPEDGQQAYTLFVPTGIFHAPAKSVQMHAELKVEADAVFEEAHPDGSTYVFVRNGCDVCQVPTEHVWTWTSDGFYFASP